MLLASGCAAPPSKEMDQAQGAIDAARAAGADRYAATEYSAATDALRNANEAVLVRDYRLALNHALESREHAQNAARLGAETQAKVRADFERSMGEINALMATARARLLDARATRVANRLLTQPSADIASAEAALQKSSGAMLSAVAITTGKILAAVAASVPRLPFSAKNLNVMAGPVLIIMIMGMMVLPLPPFALDVLFTFNIALSIMVMLVALYTVRPLDFSVFPTVLLVTTLLRLSLNVASTRVVLMEGHTGAGAAGQVIESFGHFLIGGNFAVGLIVFAILVVINFIVVTKGAERIAEVGARFALDNFGMLQESLMLVHALRPHYIKLSPGYSREIAANADRRLERAPAAHADARFSPRAAAREDVHRAGLRNRVVGLIAIHAGGAARFPVRCHGHGVSVGAQGDGTSKVVTGTGVRRLDVRLLLPRTAIAGVHVHRTAVIRAVVVLVTVDAGRAAGLVWRADRNRVSVTADGHGLARVAGKRTALSEVVVRFRVRRLQVSDLPERRGWRLCGDTPGGDAHPQADYGND